MTGPPAHHAICAFNGTQTFPIQMHPPTPHTILYVAGTSLAHCLKKLEIFPGFINYFPKLIIFL